MQLGKNNVSIKNLFAGILLLALTAAFLFVAQLLSYGPIKILRYLILLYTVCYLAWIDLKSKIVPNKILLRLTAVRAVLLAAEMILYADYAINFLSSFLLGAFLGMGILLFSNLLCKRGMGLGDVKLFGVIGFYVGTDAVMCTLFLSLVAAAVFSIVMLLSKKISAKDEFPFVPFIFAGLAVTSLLGV